MSGKTCGVCEAQLKPSDGKNKLRAAKLWPKLEKLAEFRNTVYNKEHYICEKCRWPLIKLKLPTNPEAARLFKFLVDPIIKISKRPNNFKGWQNQKKQVIQAVEPDLGDADDTYVYESETSTSVSSVSIEASQATQHSSLFDTQSETSPSDNSQQSGVSSESSQDTEFPRSLPFPSCYSTQSKCFICKSKHGRSTIPKEAIIQVFIEKRIIVPKSNRCCATHLTTKGMFKYEALELIEADKEKTVMSDEDMRDFIIGIADTKVDQSSHLDFDDTSLYSESKFNMLLGVSKDNFEYLYRICAPYLNDTKNRSSRNALAIFLIKLRLNLSQEVIAILFDVSSQGRISETFDRVLTVLYDKFVPLYLGYNHISREDLRNKHYSKLAADLLKIPEGSLIFVLDGTYIYTNKPSSFEDQRRTFSVQKGRNLVKPFMIVAPDGYIIHAEGCYFADGKNNDSSILNRILKKSNSIMNLARSGDYFVLDRGFRDSVDHVEEKNITVHIPSFLKKDQKQFSAFEANQTRIVTMVRWIVEAVNGRLKNKFKIFSSDILSSYLPKVSKIFKIACAMTNAFCQPILKDTPDNSWIAREAHARYHINNDFAEFLEKEGLLSKARVCWEVASVECVQNFPIFTEEDMKFFTLGSYQTKLAAKYTSQHLSHDSAYKIHTHVECTNVIRAKIESRFCKSASHNLWIKFDHSKQGHEGILGHYCTCKVGMRTIGVCAHIASVVWYLGHCRHNQENLPPVRNMVANILDAADSCEEED